VSTGLGRTRLKRRGELSTASLALGSACSGGVPCASARPPDRPAPEPGELARALLAQGQKRQPPGDPTSLLWPMAHGLAIAGRVTGQGDGAGWLITGHRTILHAFGPSLNADARQSTTRNRALSMNQGDFRRHCGSPGGARIGEASGMNRGNTGLFKPFGQKAECIWMYGSNG